MLGLTLVFGLPIVLCLPRLILTFVFGDAGLNPDLLVCDLLLRWLCSVSSTLLSLVFCFRILKWACLFEFRECRLVLDLQLTTLYGEPGSSHCSLMFSIFNDKKPTFCSWSKMRTGESESSTLILWFDFLGLTEITFFCFTRLLLGICIIGAARTGPAPINPFIFCFKEVTNFLRIGLEPGLKTPSF